jgi:hypothetical protein
MNVEYLYKQELCRLACASTEQKAQLLEEARTGSQQAKQRLILALLPTIWGYAIRWQRPPFMPAIELAGVGNTVLVEKFEQAMSEPNPIGYLLKYAAGEMIGYRFRYQNAITVPAKFDEPFDFIDIFDETDEFDIAEPAQEAEATIDYTPLLVAVDALPTSNARQLIRRLFGLGKQYSEDLSEIAGGDSTTKQYAAVKARKLYHLKKLREYLLKYYPDFARQHMRSQPAMVDKAVLYADIQIPEVTMRKLEAAMATLQEQGQKPSMNKLRTISGVNTKYASAYLARQASA